MANPQITETTKLSCSSCESCVSCIKCIPESVMAGLAGYGTVTELF